MSLQHILNTIDQKTQEEIDKIKQQTDTKKKAILDAAQQEAQTISNQVKAELNQKTVDKITKVKRSAETQSKNKFLMKKKAILDEIFEKAFKKLAAQEDQLKDLYQKLIKQLPQDAAGEILVSAESSAIIKDLLVQNNLNYPLKTNLTEPGLKFIGAELEIDYRLSRLIESIRDETEIQINQMLFN